MAGATLSGCYSKKSLVWSGPYQGRDIFLGLIISFKLILEAFRKSPFFRNLVKFNHVTLVRLLCLKYTYVTYMSFYPTQNLWLQGGLHKYFSVV